MNDLTTIATLTRTLINDDEKTGTDTFVYTTSSLFTLTEKNVTEITSVMVNDTESGVSYTSDLVQCRVDITSDLSVDDVITIDYSYYSNYSLNELYAYIKTALVHVSVNNINTFLIDGTTIYPEPTDSEVNLLALIAATIINPQNISYRMPDISISMPKDVNTLDKIRKILAVYKKDNTGSLFIATDHNISSI